MTTTTLFNANMYVPNGAGGKVSTQDETRSYSGGRESGHTGTADYQTFLKLLVAQMKNQDPTEPTDATQFVAQLASFSAVEQAAKTNEGLERMNEKLEDFEVKLNDILINGTITQAGSYVGKYVISHDGGIAGTVQSVKIYSDGLVATLDNGEELVIGPGVTVQDKAPAEAE